MGTDVHRDNPASGPLRSPRLGIVVTLGIAMLSSVETS